MPNFSNMVKNNNKILVTGASGFIGRKLVEHLVKTTNKDKIVCLVHKNSDSVLEKTGREAIKKYGIDPTPVDLLTGWGLDKIPKSPKIIFHLAASTDMYAKDHSINDVGTKNLLDAIGPLNKDSHFIFASSIAIIDTRLDYSMPANEATKVPERPCTEYGRKKLLTEKYIIKKAKEHGFRLSIVRITCTYGKGSRRGGLFDGVHNMVLKGSILMRLNWPGKMTSIYVGDLADFFILVSNRRPKAGSYELYIPAVEDLTLADISRTVHEAYGLKYKPINLPAWFWRTCSFFARKKKPLEFLLPHYIYITFWEACVLVNNEYWDRSIRLHKVFPNFKPMKFKEYYQKIVKNS